MNDKLYIIIVLLVCFLYVIKCRFIRNSRVRFIEVSDLGEKYMSDSAFWKAKFLSKRILGILSRPTVWTFIPFFANRVKKDGMTFVAKNRFKNKSVLLKTDKPIKSVNRINSSYHVSVNSHFNVYKNSRKIADAVDFEGNKVILEYMVTYLVMFEDNTGWVIRLRK